MNRFDESLDMWLRAERNGDSEMTAWLMTYDLWVTARMAFRPGLHLAVTTSPRLETSSADWASSSARSFT